MDTSKAAASDMKAKVDLEMLIDDFVLMTLFVGNDFLPHLPGLHIQEGALASLFGIYKAIFPRLGGCINDGGTINLKRLQIFIDELSKLELERFQEERDDMRWLGGRTGGSAKRLNTRSNKNKPSSAMLAALSPSPIFAFNPSSH